MSEGAINRARELVKGIRELEIGFPVGLTYESGQKKNALLEALKGFSHSEAMADGKALEHALLVMDIYDWLTFNHSIVLNNESLLASAKGWKRWYDEAEEQKGKLKKDNEELIEKYFKLQGKYEVISEKYDKLIEGLKTAATKP